MIQALLDLSEGEVLRVFSTQRGKEKPGYLISLKCDNKGQAYPWTSNREKVGESEYVASLNEHYEIPVEGDFSHAPRRPAREKENEDNRPFTSEEARAYVASKRNEPRRVLVQDPDGFKNRADSKRPSVETVPRETLSITHENKQKMTTEEWEEKILKITQQAKGMASDASPLAWGFKRDVKRVETKDWAAAVRVENNTGVEIMAIWIPERDGDDEENWQAVDLSGEPKG